MRHRENDGGGGPDQSGGGLTRREALQRGSLAGLGLVWAVPRVDSITMSAQFAQATSPVPTDSTQPENDTTQPENGTTRPENDTTQPENGSTQPQNGTEPTTDATTVESSSPSSNGTSQPIGGGTTVEASPPDDEVLASDLPFTGLPLEQLLPLAGGAIATGAAAVRLARERKVELESSEEEA